MKLNRDGYTPGRLNSACPEMRYCEIRGAQRIKHQEFHLTHQELNDDKSKESGGELSYFSPADNSG